MKWDSIGVFWKRQILSFNMLFLFWPKYWSFSISLSNQYSGFISFRIDWFDLLAVQGTLKSLLHTTINLNFSIISQQVSQAGIEKSKLVW